MRNNTISYESAIFWQHKEQERQEIQREDILEEVKTTQLECMDARDINYYAGILGIEPNKVRDMMLQPEDPQLAFEAQINSFADDETDSIINYF
jgi:hypothetical protein